MSRFKLVPCPEKTAAAAYSPGAAGTFEDFRGRSYLVNRGVLGQQQQQDWLLGAAAVTRPVDGTKTAGTGA